MEGLEKKIMSVLRPPERQRENVSAADLLNVIILFAPVNLKKLDGFHSHMVSFKHIKQRIMGFQILQGLLNSLQFI